MQPAITTNDIGIRLNRFDVANLHAVLKRIVDETPRIANEAVDWATARFMISSRANMHKGKKRRKIHVTSDGRFEHYKVYRQGREKPIRVWVPPAGVTGKRGQTRESIKRKFGTIKTAGAGKASWNSAMREHARVSGLSHARPTNNDIIKSKVSRVEHARWDVRNVIESELSYLRKVWPTLHVKALRAATVTLNKILDRKAGRSIERIWNGRA